MFGLNIDPYNPLGNPTGAQLAGLGVKLARYSYIDRSPGPALDPVQIEFYKGKVADLYSAGLNSLFILTYDTCPNKPVFDAPMSEWDNYINIFTARCEQIATIFGPAGVSLQIWNEPDLPDSGSYTPGLRPEVYAEMLERACAAISSASYQTIIIGAGLASGDPGWWSRVYTGQKVDVLAIHPYGQRPNPDWPNPDWGFGYIGDLIEGYKRVWKETIWITEIGEQHLEQTQQAEYLTRFYDTVRRDYSHTVGEVCWFCWADGMVTPYGLLDATGQPKAAYGAYRAAATAPPAMATPTPPVEVVTTPPADDDASKSPEGDCAELKQAVAEAIALMEAALEKLYQGSDAGE